jgi:Flp pilus assembly protein TadD
LEYAVELDPLDLDAITNLAGLEIALGNLDRARELLDRALTLDSEHPDASALMERL